MERKDLESNIRKYKYIRLFGYFLFMMPIITVFWQENGLDLRQIFILQAIYAAVILVTQIPTGHFADVYGRKLSIVMGGAAILLATVGYSISYGFIGFMIAEVLWGAGMSFISGADTALVYDTLAELKRKDDYKKIEGQAQFFSNITGGVAAILGGFIATMGLRAAVYATIIPYTAVFFIALSLKEPKRHAKIHEKGHIFHIYKIMRFALHRNKTIKWIILYSSIILSMLMIAFWFYQPYMQMIKVPLAYFGIIYAFGNLISAISSRYAYLFERKIGIKWALISLPLICVAAFFLMGKAIFAFSFMFIFIFPFVGGVRLPIVNDAINRIVWPEKRATVLSISGMVERLFFVILSPFIGWFADVYTMPQALMLSGVIVLVGGTITLIMLWRHKVL